ncbi:4a-hydroxytetrahydrobiopterin dehydratase [Candidatus Woesearchaeota archaeon]|nr:4a-hydroxytetrahydrobiopterin dehydratase [Candidatus Woesearchaeota archaeon]
MGELSKKKCKPCEGNILPFSKKQAEEYLKQIPDWKLLDNKIYREFKFKNFRENMVFVNKVAEIAEQEKHHPDLQISYDKLKITLTTHAIKGLSENDFILATKINML